MQESVPGSSPTFPVPTYTVLLRMLAPANRGAQDRRCETVEVHRVVGQERSAHPVGGAKRLVLELVEREAVGVFLQQAVVERVDFVFAWFVGVIIVAVVEGDRVGLRRRR